MTYGHNDYMSLWLMEESDGYASECNVCEEHLVNVAEYGCTLGDDSDDEMSLCVKY